MMRKTLLLIGSLFLIISCSQQKNTKSTDTQQSADYQFPSCNKQEVTTTPTITTASEYVTTRDGVKIAVDIYKHSSPKPTVLIMTRYWRQGGKIVVDFFTKHGYNVISGDVRGTGASFGVWPHHRSRDETLDFSDIMDWIVQQPWSDGNIVSWGSSYTANTADWMVERNHSALKASASRFPDYDPYTDLYFPGGVQNVLMGKGWGTIVKQMDINQKPNSTDKIKPVDSDNDGSIVAEIVKARMDVPSVWQGLSKVDFRDDTPESWKGASFDTFGIHAYADKVAKSETPIQSWASWLDAGTAHGVLNRFMTLPNPQKVFIGSWGHGGYNNSDQFILDIHEPTPSYENQLLEDLCFFNQSIDNSISKSLKSLTYYTTGRKGYRTTSTWPLPNTTYQSMYFQKENTLDAIAPKNTANEFDAYTVDFTATTGVKNRWATNNGAGQVNYGNRANEDRKLLVYDSTPLEKDTEITGYATVELFLTSTHDDGAFIVYLEDVAPDGKVTYITEGQLRGIHRKTTQEYFGNDKTPPYHSFLKSDASPMPVNEPVKLHFKLMPTSFLVKKGHQIRVAIAGADKDTFERTPAAGTPTWHILRSAKHPSKVTLPIID